MLKMIICIEEKCPERADYNIKGLVARYCVNADLIVSKMKKKEFYKYMKMLITN